jgi:hypothetical protein
MFSQTEFFLVVILLIVALLGLSYEARYSQTDSPPNWVDMSEDLAQDQTALNSVDNHKQIT